MPVRPIPRWRYDPSESIILLNVTYSVRGWEYIVGLRTSLKKLLAKKRVKLLLKSKIYSIFQGLAVCLLCSFLSVLFC